MTDHFSSKALTGEQRAVPRKPLKTRAVLSVKGAEPLAVRTVDISIQGVCLSFLQPLPIGLTGRVTIDLMIDGKIKTIDVQGRLSIHQRRFADRDRAGEISVLMLSTHV
jgi:hypothetical protein